MKCNVMWSKMWSERFVIETLRCHFSTVSKPIFYCQILIVKLFTSHVRLTYFRTAPREISAKFVSSFPFHSRFTFSRKPQNEIWGPLLFKNKSHRDYLRCWWIIIRYYMFTDFHECYDFLENAPTCCNFRKRLWRICFSRLVPFFLLNDARAPRPPASDEKNNWNIHRVDLRLPRSFPTRDFASGSTVWRRSGIVSDSNKGYK